MKNEKSVMWTWWKTVISDQGDQAKQECPDISGSGLLSIFHFAICISFCCKNTPARGRGGRPTSHGVSFWPRQEPKCLPSPSASQSPVQLAFWKSEGERTWTCVGAALENHVSWINGRLMRCHGKQPTCRDVNSVQSGDCKCTVRACSGNGLGKTANSALTQGLWWHCLTWQRALR